MRGHSLPVTPLPAFGFTTKTILGDDKADPPRRIRVKPVSRIWISVQGPPNGIVVGECWAFSRYSITPSLHFFQFDGPEAYFSDSCTPNNTLGQGLTRRILFGDVKAGGGNGRRWSPRVGRVAANLQYRWEAGLVDAKRLQSPSSLVK